MQKPQQGTYHPIVAVLLLISFLDEILEKLTDWVRKSRIKNFLILVIASFIHLWVAALISLALVWLWLKLYERLP